MKKFSITMVSLVTMAGFALAQPKADQKAAGSAAPAAKAPAAGAGSAAPAAKAPAGAGSATPAATTGSAAPAAKMEMPKPPAEIATTLKQMGNRMTCTGTTWGPDKTEMKVKATGTSALALDGWWIKGSMTITMGEGKNKGTLKIDSYQTYDAKAGKWRSIGASNDGGQMVGWSEMKGTTMETISDSTGGMMGNGKFREHGDMSDPKAGVKMTGEFSADNGKTWNKVYEMTCKK